MTKKADAWMPVYIGDYTGDTLRFITEAHGAWGEYRRRHGFDLAGERGATN